MKASAARDLAVGGPTIAAHAFQAGLVNVCHLFIAPIIVGGDGSRAFPSDIRLELARSKMNVAFAAAWFTYTTDHQRLSDDASRAADCSCGNPLR